MRWFAKRLPRRLTGVSGVLSAAHRDQRTGQVHGHTWKIVAWFTYDGTDQGVRRYQLGEWIKLYDHSCLPDRIAWGEAMAEAVGASINREYEKQGPCVAVDVSRADEGIFARWEA